MEDSNIKKLNFFDNYFDLDENSIVLDFGANIGDVSEYVYNKYHSNIYAYEPNIACFNYMKERFAKKKKVRLHNYAVSDFSGYDFLYFHNNSKGNNDIRYVQGATLRKEKDNIDVNKKIKVSIINIKEIIDYFNVIDLIKIDIEGSEYKILPELINNRNKIKKVLCEMHGNPDGKKINGKHKNKNFTKEYNFFILELKKQNLYNNWFYEWH